MDDVIALLGDLAGEQGDRNRGEPGYFAQVQGR